MERRCGHGAFALATITMIVDTSHAAVDMWAVHGYDVVGTVALCPWLGRTSCLCPSDTLSVAGIPVGNHRLLGNDGRRCQWRDLPEVGSAACSREARSGPAAVDSLADPRLAPAIPAFRVAAPERSKPHVW